MLTHVTCSYQTNMAKEVLDTILSIQPKEGGGGGGETRETVVYRQAEEMLEKLPPNYISHEVSCPYIIIITVSLYLSYRPREVNFLYRS